ncbi:hypothetical protein Pmani_035281 [Petrolisthes manimaculis]|uniref:Uncharacterized protein n=1 Tax=Petrolisthes manimaculis TaxID=1843537 RepID=A0AAE1NKV8_9EUCA|nr:hypothetical protein Pmani_035281 [Petrolisthes manimaculis]
MGSGDEKEKGDGDGYGKVVGGDGKQKLALTSRQQAPPLLFMPPHPADPDPPPPPPHLSSSNFVPSLPLTRFPFSSSGPHHPHLPHLTLTTSSSLPSPGHMHLVLPNSFLCFS